MSELEVITKLLQDEAQKTYSDAVEIESSIERISAVGKAIGLQEAVHLIVCHRLEMLNKLRGAVH